MENNDILNLTKLSRVDELTVRKGFLEKTISKQKEELESKAMLMLAKSFDEQIEEKATGTVVFFERWLKEIDKQIEEL